MVVVDIYMRLIPCRTRVLETHGLQVIRRKWIVGIEKALVGRRKGWIAAGIARCGTGRYSKLGQAIELLIRITILCPILTKRPKVMVKGAVLLRHEHNMIDRLYVLNSRKYGADSLVRGRGYLA